MTASLRPSEPADYPLIASWVADATACQRWAGPRLHFPLKGERLAQDLAVPGSGAVNMTMVDKDYGGACGFGQYWEATPGQVHLGRIIVSPKLRGTGLGKQLGQLLVAAAVKDTGAGTVTLRAYRDNTDAVRMYAKLGFVPVPSSSTEELVFMKLQVKRSASDDTLRRLA
ncbi:GNAT family N-acetyltransferase [Paucibacter sp. R3-3]|uniref:GNAT family N-acetyltransferase n=1 Tax=Roseateles agri TaxID=3098619 RepID=A0ABU5DCK6_9BURK|nr:GNAT family N-acetyltransferase [Paucibacter sp. R3-3]MDY0744011.1 GNAT family N-acetyltransferase [Paucibacter sp. R3-3]